MYDDVCIMYRYGVRPHTQHTVTNQYISHVDLDELEVSKSEHLHPQPKNKNKKKSCLPIGQWERKRRKSERERSHALRSSWQRADVRANEVRA